ncbi:mRNA export factor GLE1 isoform X1 [Cloeon dipterum]|uniref:mRNA export factor GLE1 isoform X1 n=1 Tax=Cloeon dipterum TaxID=197152 RepID=UPI003220602D
MADEDYCTPTRRVTRSMTDNLQMKTGSVVCEEVKLSALLKATKICEDQRENKKQEEIKRKEELEAFTKLISSEPPRNKSSPGANKSPSRTEEIVDAGSKQRRILEELEEERLRQVEEAVAERVDQFRANSLAIRTRLELSSKQREKERFQIEDELKEEMNKIDAVERHRTSLVLQLQTTKNAEQEKKIEKIIEDASKMEMKRKEELKAKRELLEKIVANQLKFREIYQELSDCLRSFPYKEDLMSDGTLLQDVAGIKNLTSMMETLSKQCRVGEVSNLDLTTSESLVQNLSAGYSSVKAKLEVIRESKEQNAAPGEVQAKTEPEEVVATPPAETPTTLNDAPASPEPAQAQPPGDSSEVPPGLDGFISKANFLELRRFQTSFEQHLNLLQGLEEDQSMKKFRFQLQKSVNTPLNAISAVSASHLKDKLQRLQAVLRGNPVEVGGVTVSASAHPQGVAFCTYLLAERIVEQGEQIVSSKPESAFAIASVALTLWSEFPVFGDMLMAYFYTKCPFLVPYYPPRASNTSDKSYYVSLGYNYDDEGKIEPQDKYLKRMTGTAYLFFAILTSKLPRECSHQPPQTLSIVWKWLSSLLNLDPRPDISATLLLTCLEVTGNAMCATYMKQFHKLVVVIVNSYFPLIQQVSPEINSGPISRLELFLSKTARGFVFPPPNGALPANFW